jgi:glutamine amidotransferase
MLKTIAQLNEWADDAGINEVRHMRQTHFCHNLFSNFQEHTLMKHFTTQPSLLNFAVTDGESVVCARYVSSATLEAPSLYFSSGTKFESYEPGHYRMVKADRREDMVVVASGTYQTVIGNPPISPSHSIRMVACRASHV